MMSPNTRARMSEGDRCLCCSEEVVFVSEDDDDVVVD